MTNDKAIEIKKEIEQAVEAIKAKHGLRTEAFTFTDWDVRKGAFSTSHLVDTDMNLEVQVDIKVKRW